ncbi:hypothetical protein [Cellulomonas gilvus]|jgi:hypothetical protein|uniref:Integral membrane protein n=1 Tax=Cellulomonas gilvus (strain ATCC 13127 / NRRL B-14078) TaxID=593907 RepID=F8A1W7_CELGA|nr:hypothetical protein [Cellulomonas gilvus]AEI12911.1 integral membrane protein [Cellulomonas gilvus ATCC 13127]
MTDAPARPSLARPLALVLASGAALVGIALLLVSWVSVGTSSFESSERAEIPCLTAVDADAPGARTRNELVPPRTLCEWTNAAGEPETVVLGEASPAVFWLGGVLFVGGVLTCVGLLVAPRLRR